MSVTVQRVNQFLLVGILITIILYYARQILMPIALGAMFAMLMAPLSNWLESKRLPRVLSSLACVMILLVFIIGMMTLVSAEIASFSKEKPQIEKKVDQMINASQDFVQEEFNVEPNKQKDFVKKQISSLGKAAGSHAGKILGGIVGTIATVILTLVFTFLMLFNRERYENFFIKLYKEKKPEEIREVLSQITKVSQAYLTGRAISMSIQAVLFSVGLTIIGIKNAILLGCVAALLTILPYVGPIVGGLFPVVMAIVTEDNFNPVIMVMCLLAGIQVIDNYFIEPNVVGGKVNLSAIVTINIIIIGGTIWGVVGMVLFTPMLGIVKIIFEHVEHLKPYAYLIGDDDKDSTTNLKSWIKKKVEG